MVAEALQQGMRLLGRLDRFDQFHLAAGKIIVLDVDQ
jgi:hypothetical protein